MKKILVSYFSASGVTKNTAIRLKNLLNSDIFEIEPLEPYTDEDLNWMNKNSRSSFEKTRDLFFSIFSAEPWNDDWSDKEQLNTYIKELMGNFNSLSYGLFLEDELI